MSNLPHSIFFHLFFIFTLSALCSANTYAISYWDATDTVIMMNDKAKSYMGGIAPDEATVPWGSVEKAVVETPKTNTVSGGGGGSSSSTTTSAQQETPDASTSSSSDEVAQTSSSENTASVSLTESNNTSSVDIKKPITTQEHKNVADEGVREIIEETHAAPNVSAPPTIKDRITTFFTAEKIVPIYPVEATKKPADIVTNSPADQTEAVLTTSEELHGSAPPQNAQHGDNAHTAFVNTFFVLLLLLCSMIFAHCYAELTHRPLLLTSHHRRILRRRKRHAR